MSDEGPPSARVVVPALLVTGAPGVGKTVVAREIGELLRLAGAPHAVIDLDELGRAAGLPAVTDDDYRALIVRNLTTVWPIYRALGVERLVLVRIVERASDVDELRRAIPGAVLTVCRLTAPTATVQERLRRRETGTALDFLLRVSGELDTTMDELAVADLTVENAEGRPITDVAAEVLTGISWPAPNAASGDRR